MLHHLRARAHAIIGVSRRRWLSSAPGKAAARPSRPKTINLTPYASPLLLRLHPDRMQQHNAPDLAADNEEAMKQLNQFLAIAGFGCNNDGYRARKQILSLTREQHDDPDAPIRFWLRFHVPDVEGDGRGGFAQVDHTLEVPGALVRRTLLHGTRAATSNLSDALATPFAREWQRTTKRILRDLFAVARIPLYANGGDDPNDRSDGDRITPTQLALWLEEEDRDEMRHERGVVAHNRAMHRLHQAFDVMFEGLLAKEKNIVHPVTTGLEDGPTTQHAILTKLVAQRVFLEKIPDREEKRRVFFWLANLLLMNFMELRLHSLVWNKVTLLVTTDETLTTPQVLWEPERPEEGMGILIPADMDTYALVDALYEPVQELELALNQRAKQTARRVQREQRRRGATLSPTNRRKKKHFYADEVAAMFRR